MQKEKTPHPHAAMIAEWILDTSRVVEFFDSDYRVRWVKCCAAPEWREDTKYRFADTVKPEIVSSLSNDEIKRIFWNGTGGMDKGLMLVADAAAKRAHAEGYQAAIDAVCAMSNESSLFDKERLTYQSSFQKECAAISLFQYHVKRLLKVDNE